MLDGLKSTFTRKRIEQSDIHRRLNSVYPDAPQWWFIVLFLLALAMDFGALTDHVPEAPKWVHLSIIVLMLVTSHHLWGSFNPHSSGGHNDRCYRQYYHIECHWRTHRRLCRSRQCFSC